MRAVYTSEVSSDYGTGQAEAASRTLIELCSLFEQYEDDIRIIGGWVPDLMLSLLWSCWGIIRTTLFF